MANFLEAAYQVLDATRQPLSAQEIVDIALERRLIRSRGKTPAHTMKSKLSTDILRSGRNSIFMRSAKGTFALRAWKPAIGEYTAKRFKAAVFDEDIVVLPATIVRAIVPQDGLNEDIGPPDYLYSQLRPMRRRLAEDDRSVVQLVSVFIVRHCQELLTYKRTKRLPESRLHGFYSMAFGGHLNPDDVSSMFGLMEADLGNRWLLRELNEEVIIEPKHIRALTFRGAIYDSSRPVSRLHLGIVYEVLVSTPQFEIGERGFLTDAKYESPDQIRARFDQFENWSQILFERLEPEWR